MIDLVWLVPLLPVAAFILIAATARKLGDRSAWFGILAILASTVIAGGALAQHIGGARWAGLQFDWLVTGALRIPLGLQMDSLAAITLFVVCFVSLTVHIYSLGYMHGDARYTRYYAVLSLFTAGMLGLVLTDNFFILLISWEIMGLCSYLLIGHWYENEVPQKASMKAFLTTRVGDVAMMVGIWVLFWQTGSFRFADIQAKTATMDPGVLLLGVLLLFGGAIGKSAQFPLHVWLPDAMAGPTPASSLIHAATMVAAGVYLVARTFAIFAAASPVALLVVAIIGGFTALFAATIATLRTDIKQVVAYSTISSLGYMMLGLGSGFAPSGAFYLVTHAFFKALLFQCAGSVIHAVHSQEMHEMGGLRRKLPITFWTWMVGTLALMGIPPFSGYFAKDAVLLGAYRLPERIEALGLHGLQWIGTALFWMGIATAFLTAYFMTRATWLTFFGRPRDHHKYEHAHESPWQMTLPLVLLAIPSLIAGLPQLGVEHLLEIPGSVEAEHAGIVPILASGAALGGILVGLFAYAFLGPVSRRGVIRGVRPLYALVKNKFYIDELYDVTVIALTFAVSKLVALFDQYVVDGIVNLIGQIGEGLSTLSGEADRRIVDGAVNAVADLTLFLGRSFRRLQTGLVQSYMLTMVIGVIIAIIILAGVWQRAFARAIGG